MSLFKWSDKIAVDIEELDKQNKVIIESMGSIVKAINNQNYQIAIRQTRNLLDYWDIHFRYEEELMKQNGYSNYAAHKSEHGDIIQKLSILLNLASYGEKYVVDRIALLLNTWLENHLVCEGKKLGKYLKSKGVS